MFRSKKQVPAETLAWDEQIHFNRVVKARVRGLNYRIIRLEQDSHPPQPIITEAEFLAYKQSMNVILSELMAKIDLLELRLFANG